MKWSVKGSKTSSKDKTFISIRKNFFFYSKSEKGPAKGTVPLDLYNAERVSPTQIDLVATGDGWQLAKGKGLRREFFLILTPLLGVERPQICLGFDTPAIADKWLDELTKKTARGFC